MATPGKHTGKGAGSAKTTQASAPTAAVSPVTGSTTLGAIVERHPEAIGVLFAHGLHCIGCQFAATETLEQGCAAHGMTQAQITALLKDINKSISDAANRPPIMLTDAAATTIKDVMKATGKTGGLRVIALEGGGTAADKAGHDAPPDTGNTTYDLTIEPAPNKDDVVLEHKGVKIYVDKQSLKRARGCTIDYLEHKQGFAVRR